MIAPALSIPDYTEWTAHDGGESPLVPEAMCFIRYRNGKEIDPVQAKSRRWKRWGRGLGISDFDVKFFRVETAV